MNEINPVFFSTIAQVSATFIGFALLTPVFRAVASGHISSVREYILLRVFYMKWLLLLLLPIFVFCYPLIGSLVLLKYNANLLILPDWIRSLYRPFSIGFGFAIIIFYFGWIRTWSKLPGPKEDSKLKIPLANRWLVETLPPLCIVVCLLMWFGLFGNLKWVFILIIISGFLFIVRNIGIDVYEGIYFEKEELSTKLKNGKDEFIRKMSKAIETREEKVIEGMSSLLQSPKLKDEKEKEDLKRSLGYQHGEIENLKRLLKNKQKKGIEDLYNEINEKKKKKKLTIKDFSEFEGRRTDGEKRIEEFEAGTVLSLNVLKVKYPENEYGVRWDDESD